jgi:FixJ family two-component response regulator
MDVAAHLAGRVVLVDDDPSLLHALRFSFEADGYDVTALSSGEALLKAALDDERLCIVIDERLSGYSGLETLRRLRMRGVSAPAILITSHPSRELVRRAAAFGVPIVEKPLLGDALSKRVNEALGALGADAI